MTSPRNRGQNYRERIVSKYDAFRTLVSRRSVVKLGAWASLAGWLGKEFFASTEAAAASLSFGHPCDVRNISDDWNAHIARGSAGGTDFTAAYGSNLYAMAAGTVSALSNSTAGSGGRYVEINHGAMGPYATVLTQSLHLSVIGVSVGQRVSRGQVIGKTGASAYGSETGTGGPHVHVHGLFDGKRANLEPYISSSPSTKKKSFVGGPSDMKIVLHRVGTNLCYYKITDYAIEALPNGTEARALAKGQTPRGESVDDYIPIIEGSEMNIYVREVNRNIGNLQKAIFGDRDDNDAPQGIAQFKIATTLADVSDAGNGSVQKPLWFIMREVYRKVVLGK